MCRKRGALSAELPDIGAPAVLDAVCKSDGFAGRCSNPRVECKYQHLRLFCRSMRYDQCWPRGEEAFGAVRQSFARAAACRSMPITDMRSAATKTITPITVGDSSHMTSPSFMPRKGSMEKPITMRRKFANPRALSRIDCDPGTGRTGSSA